MNKILDLSLRLALVCAVAALALAYTADLTKNQIDAQKSLSVNDALKYVLPGADDFRVKEGYYEAYEGEELIGYAKIVSKSGYSSNIQMMVGIDANKKITGVSVISQEETPGLGTNVAKKEFLDQFIGKDISTLTLKKYGGNIDGITGATISSQAAVDALKSWKFEASSTTSTESNAITDDALKKVLPDADNFKKIEDHYEAYKGQDIIGYAKQVSRQGHDSMIELLVGIDTDKKITSVIVLSQEETPTKGARITEQEFLDQFRGKDISDLALKKDGGEIDGITGATTTSQAFIDALKSWDLKDYSNADQADIVIDKDKQLVIGNQSMTVEIE